MGHAIAASASASPGMSEMQIPGPQLRARELLQPLRGESSVELEAVPPHTGGQTVTVLQADSSTRSLLNINYVFK